MTKYYRFVLLAMLLSACVDEPIQHTDSRYKADIVRYLNQSATANLALTDRIDFSQVHEYPLHSKERLLIAPLKPLEAIVQQNQKIALFLNDGEIVRSNIVAFSGRTGGGDGDRLLVDILNMEPEKPAYTGEVAIYSLQTRLLQTATFDKGKLTGHGMARPTRDTRQAGRTQGCIDWYLITTWYFAWGTTTNETYIYTTCTCEEEAFRTSRSACGGGSSSGGRPGSGGPNFPQNPANNAEYEYTGPDGKVTLYRYSEATRMWTIVMVVLPPAVVIAEQAERPFLNYKNPVDGELIFGSDNFLYEYDGASGNWTGEQVYINSPPVHEYDDRCHGLLAMWNNYPINETHGYLTPDGKLIVTDIGSYDHADVGRLYRHQGKLYYVFLSDRATENDYEGMIVWPSNRYFIQVVASVHTHVACKNDWTSGLSYVGTHDSGFASDYPELRHWVVGCNSIGQFDGRHHAFFNVSSGTLNKICNNIK